MFLAADFDECVWYEAICGPLEVAKCINTAGSYACECANGYRLENHKCVGTYSYTTGLVSLGKIVRYDDAFATYSLYALEHPYALNQRPTKNSITASVAERVEVLAPFRIPQRAAGQITGSGRCTLWHQR